MAYTFSDNSCNPWSTSNPTCTLGGHVAYDQNIRSFIRNTGRDYLGNYIELYNTIHRSYGLSADHVLEWEVVAASGGLIAANPDSHQDLLWALCGIGGARTA
ncbi:hypothetical protein HBH64_021060 [Parastagonospora nodorum]|nr:hypothetical protein HBH53_220500 [Parastagonospora nodorum]KAH4234802.1 hypothetical protein HBI06_063140 [Parastagonospora nodorum]KAH4250201.1 hypothetical protein HBI05_015340 [Parastagonospora nodorum]KAH4285100.1 hypothetical protein HBI02_237260 [Parastagonospora nodorum]KAH4290570.1 hypothetical protein HBI01_198490 [Parastagonospora nodorum]